VETPSKMVIRINPDRQNYKVSVTKELDWTNGIKLYTEKEAYQATSKIAAIIAEKGYCEPDSAFLAKGIDIQELNEFYTTAETIVRKALDKTPDLPQSQKIGSKELIEATKKQVKFHFGIKEKSQGISL
jgi:hypothetical protein